MEIDIEYLSASDNPSVSHISYPLYYSYSEIQEISGADILYIGTGYE